MFSKQETFNMVGQCLLGPIPQLPDLTGHDIKLVDALHKVYKQEPKDWPRSLAVLGRRHSLDISVTGIKMMPFAYLLPSPPTEKERGVAAEYAIELVHVGNINPVELTFDRRVDLSERYFGVITNLPLTALILIIHMDVALFLKGDKTLDLRIFPAHTIVLEKHSCKPFC
jgi:hypothetical protein